MKQQKEEIEPDNYLQIAEGIIQRLETQCKVKEGVWNVWIIYVKAFTGMLERNYVDQPRKTPLTGC